MREACYCGRTGEIEDRQPVVDANGERALRCPVETCGHLDYLRAFSDETRLLVFEEASRRRAQQVPAA